VSFAYKKTTGIKVKVISVSCAKKHLAAKLKMRLFKVIGIISKMVKNQSHG
jgi:hypothetical protein